MAASRATTNRRASFSYFRHALSVASLSTCALPSCTVSIRPVGSCLSGSLPSALHIARATRSIRSSPIGHHPSSGKSTQPRRASSNQPAVITFAANMIPSLGAKMEKKFVAVIGLVGAVTLMSAGPHGGCEHRALCEIKAPDLPHAEERIPSAERTTDRVTITSSSSVHHLVASDLVTGSPLFGAPTLA